MARPMREHDALPFPQKSACPSTVNCPLPHASCIRAVPPENSFSFGVRVAIAVCAFILAGATALFFGVAEQLRLAWGWLEALRPKSRRGK